MVHEPGINKIPEHYPKMTLFFSIGCSTRRACRMMATILLMGSYLIAAAPAVADESPVVLIAHPGVTTPWLNRDTTRAIFAMRQRTWPDGQAVQVYVLDSSNSVHARFCKERLSVYPHQLQLAWDRMVFSGTGQAPNRVSNQIEMREKIANTPGAIGYIEREYLDDSVQVISMD